MRIAGTDVVGSHNGGRMDKSFNHRGKTLTGTFAPRDASTLWKVQYDPQVRVARAKWKTQSSDHPRNHCATDLVHKISRFRGCLTCPRPPDVNGHDAPMSACGMGSASIPRGRDA